MKNTVHESARIYWNGYYVGGYHYEEDVEKSIDNLIEEMTVNYESSKNDMQRKDEGK